MNTVSATQLSNLSSSDLRDLDVTEGWCLTGHDLIHSLTWTIDDFSKRKEKPGHRIASSIFPSQGDHGGQYQILLYPMGSTYGDKDYISVSLQDVKESHTNLTFSISVLNQNQEQVGRVIQDICKIDRFMKKSRLLDGLLPGDKLTIYCEVYSPQKLRISSGPSIDQWLLGQCTLVSDLARLFDDQKLSDVTFAVDKKEFKAHKAILASRSPVFRAMFSHDMQEKKSNRVEITDLDPYVFEELLRYIYNGQPVFEPALGENQETSKTDASQCSFAMDLLKAATRYQLEELKSICERRIFSQLSVDCVMDVLCLVDQYQAPWLKHEAMKFVLFHTNEVTKIGAWKSLTEHYPQLVVLLLTSQWPAEIEQADTSVECQQPTSSSKRPTHHQSLHVTKDWCLTKNTVTRHSINWTFDNFSSLKYKERIYSFTFLDQNGHKTKWKLQSSYKEYRHNYEPEFIIELIKSEKGEDIEVNFGISLLNVKQEKVETVYRTFDYGGFNGMMIPMSRIPNGKALFDDKLTIYCEVEVPGDLSRFSGSMMVEPPLSRPTLITDMVGLYNNENCCDLTITVGERQFNAHKAILAVRWPVFSAKFGLDMRTNVVEVNDIEPNVFEELLRYVYTGQLLTEPTFNDNEEKLERDTSQELSEEQMSGQTVGETRDTRKNEDNQRHFPLQLLKAASEYQLDGLKLIFEHRVYKQLSVERLVEILCLVTQYHSHWLKPRDFKFALSHKTEFDKSGGWKYLSEHNPGLLAEILASHWPADSEGNADH